MSEDSKSEVKETQSVDNKLDSNNEAKEEQKSIDEVTDTTSLDSVAAEMGAGKKKSTVIIRTILLAVLVIAAAFAIKRHMMVKEYNNALALKNAGNLKDATPRFELLVKRSYGEVKANANIRLLECYIESGNLQKANDRLDEMSKDPSVTKVELAKCYITLGESPSCNAAQSRKYYKKALDLAPQILTDVQHKAADPSYQLPKPPPPTKEELEQARKMSAEELKKHGASALDSVKKALPTTKK